MKGELEKVTKAKLKKLLTEVGVYHVWPVPGGYGAALLDCYACWNGEFHAIETKRQGLTKPDPRQRNTMADIRKAGGHTWLVTLDPRGNLLWLRQGEPPAPVKHTVHSAAGLPARG